MMPTSIDSQPLTRREKLALGAARLRERYSQHPSYARRAAKAQDPDAFWERLAASNFNSWQLPPLKASSIPAAAEA